MTSDKCTNPEKTKRPPLRWEETRSRLAAWSRSRAVEVFIHETDDDFKRLVRLVLRMQREARRG